MLKPENLIKQLKHGKVFRTTNLRVPYTASYDKESKEYTIKPDDHLDHMTLVNDNTVISVMMSIEVIDTWKGS